MAVRDWEYQYYYKHGLYLCLLECNHIDGETLVCFRHSQKYRFHEPELHQIAMAVIVNGESLCGYSTGCWSGATRLTIRDGTHCVNTSKRRSESGGKRRYHYERVLFTIWLRLEGRGTT